MPEQPYVEWLATLEATPQTRGFDSDQGWLRTIPGGALTTLSAVVDLLGSRLAPAQHSSRVSTAIPPVVVTCVLPEASALYSGRTIAADGLIQAIRERVEDLPTALVQTLPWTGEGRIDAQLDAANAAITALTRQTPTAQRLQLVPIHRGANLDVLLGADRFADVAQSLRRLGREARVGYLWNQVLDLGWLHWQAIAAACLPKVKVVISDLDGVLWPGTIAEDGIPDVVDGHGPIAGLTHQAWCFALEGRQRTGLLLAAAVPAAVLAVRAGAGRLVLFLGLVVGLDAAVLAGQYVLSALGPPTDPGAAALENGLLRVTVYRVVLVPATLLAIAVPVLAGLALTARPAPAADPVPDREPEVPYPAPSG